MKRVLWGLAFFLWITGIATLFYLVPQQRPVDGMQLRRWWTLSRAVLGAGLIGGSAISLGAWSLRRLRLAQMPDTLHFLSAATLGLGLESAAMLLVGMLGGANGWGTWGVLLGGWMLAPRTTIRLTRRTAQRLRRAWRDTERGLRTYTALTLGISGLNALLPPIDWDGLFYHLTGPKLALAAGRIGWLDRAVPHFNFPWLGESLYLLALRTAGEAAPKLLHWGTSLLLVGWIAWWAYRRWGERGAQWAGALFLAMPMVATLAGMAYTDLFLTLFAVAECALLAEATTAQRSASWFGLAGLLGGLATGVKYTSLTWPLSGLLLTLLYDTHQPAPRGHRTLAFLGGAIGGGFIWPLKNLICTGNPVYPFVWGGPEWDSIRMAWYQSAGSGIWGDWKAIALLPLHLTLGIRDMNFYDGRTGPLWLILLPLVLAWAWAHRRRPWPPQAWGWLTIVILGGAHALLWLWGVLTTQNLYQSRLMLPALAVYTWLSVAAVLWLRPRRIGSASLYTFFKLFTALVLLSNGLYQVRELVRLRPGPYLMGVERRDDYLARNLGITWGALQAVNALPAADKVLFLWEPRTYYATVDAYPDPILDRWNHLYRTYGTASAIAHALHEQGFTHLLTYTYGMSLVRRNEVKGPKPPAEAWTQWDAFVAHYLKPVATPPGYVLYTWSDAP